MDHKNNLTFRQADDDSNKKASLLSIGNKEQGHPLTRATLAGNQTHFRSQAFDAIHFINPLISSAAPLISIAAQLRQQSIPPDFEQLHAMLCHEIKALECQAHINGYRSQVILGARYFL